ALPPRPLGQPCKHLGSMGIRIEPRTRRTHRMKPHPLSDETRDPRVIRKNRERQSRCCYLTNRVCFVVGVFAKPDAALFIEPAEFFQEGIPTKVQLFEVSTHPLPESLRVLAVCGEKYSR